LLFAIHFLVSVGHFILFFFFFCLPTDDLEVLFMAILPTRTFDLTWPKQLYPCGIYC